MADYYVNTIAAGLAVLHTDLSSQTFINYENALSVYPFDLLDFNEQVAWKWDDFFTALAWEELMSNAEDD
jgi:hypothetical protein